MGIHLSYYLHHGWWRKTSKHPGHTTILAFEFCREEWPLSTRWSNNCIQEQHQIGNSWNSITSWHLQCTSAKVSISHMNIVCFKVVNKCERLGCVLVACNCKTSMTQRPTGTRKCPLSKINKKGNIGTGTSPPLSHLFCSIVFLGLLPFSLFLQGPFYQCEHSNGPR